MVQPEKVIVICCCDIVGLRWVFDRDNLICSKLLMRLSFGGLWALGRWGFGLRVLVVSDEGEDGLDE